MKEFKVLPNDPLLQSLSQEQQDFILLSMSRDNDELIANARGDYIDGDFEDKDFEEIAELADEDEDWEIMREGQDPDKIHEAVVRLTGDTEFEDAMHNKLEAKREESYHKEDRKRDLIKNQHEFIKEIKESSKNSENGKIDISEAMDKLQLNSIRDSGLQ